MKIPREFDASASVSTLPLSETPLPERNTTYRSSKKGEMTMTTLHRLAGLIVCGCLTWAGPARADAVTDWNATTLEVLVAGAATRPTPTGILDIAMVHI